MNSHSTKVVASHHDHLFQIVFADPKHAVPLLRSALPASIHQIINWSTLARFRVTHRGRRGKKTICDVVFSARTRRGRKILLYVILEHKARSSRFDAFQMLDQIVGVLRTHRREHPKDKFLPLVIPVVVHADHRPWQSPLDVRELFDLENIPAELHPYLPSCRYFLDDLQQEEPEQLRQRRMTIYGLCTLGMLRYLPAAGRNPKRFDALMATWAQYLEQAEKVAQSIGERGIIDSLVDYIMDTTQLPVATVNTVLQQRLQNPTMKNRVLSTAQRIRKQGKAEGKASVLLRQILRRFGKPDPDIAARIESASPSQLDRWADRILDAKSLDELFAG